MPEGALKTYRRTQPQRPVLSDGSFDGMTPTGQLKLYLQAKQKYGKASPEVARGNLQTALEWAPGTGDVVAAKDAWDYSGEAADALTEGDFSDALGNYGKMALALAAVAPFVPNLVRSADPQRTATTFAGIGAKTADKDALARAEKMESEGVDPSRIWSETGWGRGADGQWRFEIDDRPARLRGNRGSLGQSFDHPELYAAYPELRAYGFSRNPPPGTSGTFHGASVSVEPGRGTKSTTLHETQHAVQDRERFARGGPLDEPPAMTPLTGLNARRAFQALDIAASAQWHGMSVDDYVKMRRRFADDPDEPVPFTDPDGKPIDAKSIELAKDRDKLDDLERRRELGTSRGTYHHLAGEVEARNVSKRRNFTPEQRRATPPWETEDVPRAKQVIRYGY